MAPKPTQDFVPIKEVRDGIAVMKDGSMRAILLTSSLNFSLKSADEQKSIIYQFQNFLNSLDFSIQIAIQSRRLDIKPYLAMLENQQKEQTNDLMKIQIKEYREFIQTFTDSVNIMTKNFFIVIPYTPPQLSVSKAKGFINKEKSSKQVKKMENFEENRSQLEQRLSVVLQGINRTGVRASRLGTEEIIEVYYKIFNPGDVGEPMNISQ
jgi:type IV secretory pathway VirB4 component